MPIGSLFSFMLGNTALSQTNAATSENAFFSGAKAAALAGMAVLGTACSNYEGQDTTTLLSITGGTMGVATTLFWLARRRKPSPESRPAQPVSRIVTAEEQMAALTESIARTPTAEAYQARGKAKETAGDLAGAIEDYSRGIEMNPKNARLLLWRGSARSNNGDHQGAIEDYTRAIAIDDKYAGAYFHRAMAKEELGLLEAAREDYLVAKKAAAHGGIGIFADRSLRALEKRISAPPPAPGTVETA